LESLDFYPPFIKLIVSKVRIFEHEQVKYNILKKLSGEIIFDEAAEAISSSRS